MLYANLILGSRLSFLGGYFKDKIIDFFLVPLQGFHSSLVLTDSILNLDRWSSSTTTTTFSWRNKCSSGSCKWILRGFQFLSSFINHSSKIFYHLGVFKELIPLGCLFETLEGIGNLCLLTGIYREQQLIRFNESSKLFDRHLILLCLLSESTFFTNFHHRAAITTQWLTRSSFWITLRQTLSIFFWLNRSFSNLTVSINK